MLRPVRGEASRLVEEREKVVLGGAALLAGLAAGARAGRGGKLPRPVQERQQVIRVHVVQLQYNHQASLNGSF